MAKNLSYPAEGIRLVRIEVLAGDAIVRGLAAAETIEAEGRGEFVPDGDALRLAGQVDRVFLPESVAVQIVEAQGDLRVQALAVAVEVGEIHGDLRLDRVSGAVAVGDANGDVRFMEGGSLTCRSVGGDLRVENAGDVHVTHIHGDLWMDRVAGSVAIKRVDGDARLGQVGGPVTLQELSGDLRAQALTGGLSAPQIGGDADVHGPFTGEAGYTIAAEGDVHLHLSTGDDVRLALRAWGRIRAHVPLTPTADGTPTYAATVGNGTCPITATSGGDLRVASTGGPAPGAGGTQPGVAWERRRGSTDSVGELSNLADRIRQQVATSLASAGINLETGEVDLRRGGRGARGYRGPHAPTPPTPPRPQASQAAAPGRQHPSGATSTEQMTILKMVEEGRITPEEADILLRALGG